MSRRRRGMPKGQSLFEARIRAEARHYRETKEAQERGLSWKEKAALRERRAAGGAEV